MTPAVRRWFLPTTAVALGVLLLFHPQSDGRMYDRLRIVGGVVKRRGLLGGMGGRRADAEPQGGKS
jgi:hypothetical protein